MNRNFSLSEAAKKAKEQSTMWSSHYQNAGTQNEETPEESFAQDGFVDNNETAKQDQSNEVAPGPGPALRPKFESKPAQQAVEATPEKSALDQPGDSERPGPASQMLKRKSAPFTDRYERVTTYLEKPLHRLVHDLHERGEIAKIANLFNAAVREYLERHYPS